MDQPPDSRFEPDGGRAAFDLYVKPEIDVLYRVALSLTRSQHDAEDLVQDTLLRAYRSIGRFDGRFPRAWLLTIMRNANMNRHRRRRPTLLRDEAAAHDRLAETPADAAGPEDIVVDGSLDPAVKAAFSALPDRLQSVVTLVDLDGLSYKEAADALGTPVGTVMSRLHRARKRMREHLAKAGILDARHRSDATETGGGQ